MILNNNFYLFYSRTFRFGYELLSHRLFHGQTHRGATDAANFRNGIDWHHMSKTVKNCAEDALSKHYDVFGVQFYGECWSGDEGYKTYDKDGFNLQGCWEGVGKSNNNYVYAFTSK